MAARKNCKHQGFAYAKNGYKNIRIICDLTGKIHDKKYCEKCEYYEPHTPKERDADKPKITCLNCKHLMFSDMYGECNKQLRIVHPSDTCKYAEPKERGGEK